MPQCCYDLREPCLPTCRAFFEIATMDGPEEKKVICLRLVRENSAYVAANKAVDIDTSTELPADAVHSQAPTLMYR